MDFEKDFEGTKPDGILGLSNNKKINNIFDIAHADNQLISSVFGFQLGLRALRQPSFFYYNISLHEDFPSAFFVKASRNGYWTIPIQKMSVDSSIYPAA